MLLYAYVRLYAYVHFSFGRVYIRQPLRCFVGFSVRVGFDLSLASDGTPQRTSEIIVGV